MPVGVGEIERGHALGAPGAVDHDVDLAEFGDDAVEQRLERGAVGDVAGKAKGAPAGLLDLGGGFGDELRAARGGNDVGTRLGETACEHAADAGGGADDDCGTAGEVEGGERHAADCIAGARPPRRR